MKTLENEKVPLAEGTTRPTDPVVEIPILVESSLLAVLEAAAREHGMTAGSMVRRLIRDFLYYSDGSLSASQGRMPPEDDWFGD
jgi:hypothetical protein